MCFGLHIAHLAIVEVWCVVELRIGARKHGKYQVILTIPPSERHMQNISIHHTLSLSPSLIVPLVLKARHLSGSGLLYTCRHALYM